MYPDIEPEHPRIRKYALDISSAAQSIFAKQQRIDLLQSRCKHPMNRLITKKQGLYCPVCGFNFKEVTSEVLAESTKVQMKSAGVITSGTEVQPRMVPITPAAKECWNCSGTGKIATPDGIITCCGCNGTGQKQTSIVGSDPMG